MNSKCIKMFKNEGSAGEMKDFVHDGSPAAETRTKAAGERPKSTQYLWKSNKKCAELFQYSPKI